MKKQWVFFFVVAFFGLALAQDNDYEYYEDFNKPEVDAIQSEVNKEADNDQIFNFKQDDDYDFDDTLKGWFEEEKYAKEKAVDENANRSEDGSVQLDTDTKVDQEIQQFLGYVDEAQDAEALDVNDYQVEDNRPILEEVQNEPNKNDGIQLEVAKDASSEIVVETKDLLEDNDSQMDINEDNNDLINSKLNKNELNSLESEEVDEKDFNKDEVDSLESFFNEKDTEDIQNPIEDIDRLSALVNEAIENEENENADEDEIVQNSENNSDESLAMDIEEKNEDTDDIQTPIEEINRLSALENEAIENKEDENADEDENAENSQNNYDESLAIDSEERNAFWGVLNGINEDDNQNNNKYEFNEESNIKNEPELKEESSFENRDDNIDKDLKEKINELNNIYDKVAQNSYLRVEKDNTEEDNVEENFALFDEEKNGPFREKYVLALREQLLNDEINGIYQNDFDDIIEPDGQHEIDKNAIVVEAVPYLNDTISNEIKSEIVNDDDIENINDIESDDNEIAVDHVDQLLDLVKEVHVLFSPNLDNLTNSELEDLDKQFSLDHKEDLDVNSDNFDRNVAPIRMHLEVGVPVVITSPNYPEPYPTNNIIDWILEGNGMGIELNITDLSVNGFMGDYLLVKPGGIDESGHEGLLFSYQLRSVRRYRFLDVNRLFVRFEALPGMAFSRGFSYTVKLLSHLPEPEEPMPEPEPIISLPDETLLVFLGGVTTEEFRNITEDFRLIVADMATLYINANGIDIGNVTIDNATHITMVQVCHIAWPGFESCAGVHFGVQLENDVTPGLTELQLEQMWRSYVDSDPFASRLRRLGVTEFAVPNDGTTLMVWLVIGLGVAISAGMLALALWRWTCYDEYSRMPAFNDTDSIISNEKKKNLDLYPTPHQTLPPLYNDEFIKYEDSTRVDMGGFANQSYTRDAELYDLESDDEVGALPRGRQHRKTYIQPKDIY